MKIWLKAFAKVVVPIIGLATVMENGFAKPVGENKHNNVPSNIVLILADDAGYADFGFQGSEQMQTSHLDRMAAEGARFTQAYVSTPFCSPSRAGLITGRYQQRFGHEGNLQGKVPFGVDPAAYGLPISEKTLADRLKQAGYTTALFGKWHLGEQEHFRPLKRGFDRFYGFLSGQRSYFPGADQGREYTAIFDQDKVTSGEDYLTDELGQITADFIRSQSDKPFFVFLSFSAVHGPMHAVRDDFKHFSHIDDLQRRLLAAMTYSMDRAIGQVFNALKDRGVADNTLVIFLSDNGGANNVLDSSNAPLRGAKGTLLEGGIRVPFLARWPGRIKAGTVIDTPASALDIFPTALTAAGLPTDDNLDGISLMTSIKGKPTKRSAFFWRINNAAAIRDGDWKLIRFPDRMPELYNLSKDIGETTNLSLQQPKRSAQMLTKLFEWERGLAHPLWFSDYRFHYVDIDKYDSDYLAGMITKSKAKIINELTKNPDAVLFDRSEK